MSESRSGGRGVGLQEGRRRPGRTGLQDPPAAPPANIACSALRAHGGGLVLEHRVPGVGDHEQVRVRDLRGDGARVRGGGAQVVGAAEDQRGDIRQRRRCTTGGAGVAKGQKAQLRSSSKSSTFAGVNGRDRARREGVDLGGLPARSVRGGSRCGSTGTPPLHRSWCSRAARRSLRLLRLRHLRRARAAVRAARCRRSSAARTAAGNSARRNRVEVAGEQDLDQFVGGDVDGVAVAVAVDHAPAHGAAAHTPHEPREVGDRVGGDVGTLAVGAELAQDARASRRRLAGRAGLVRWVSTTESRISASTCWGYSWAYSSATLVP